MIQLQQRRWHFSGKYDAELFLENPTQTLNKEE